MNARLKQLKAHFSKLRVGAILIQDDVNVGYFCGIPSRDSWLVVLPRQAFYLTDMRYSEEVKKKLPGLKVVLCRDSLVSGLRDLFSGKKVTSCGIDERQVSVSLFKRIKRASPKGMKWADCGGVIDQLREIKDQGELKNVKKAIDINLRAFSYFKKILKPGLSEAELYTKLEQFVRRHKAKFSFPPIIASGPNSSYPHAQITSRKVGRKDAVLLDLGIEWNGYKSDLTRMFFLGKITPRMQEVMNAVGAAQRKAIDVIRPGISAAKIDQEARKHLESFGLAKYFGHSLGHGVGLEIHESPRISSQSKVLLKQGMLFTVEPGVYFPHKFGIRIEDMVYVTKNSCKVLSCS